MKKSIIALSVMALLATSPVYAQSVREKAQAEITADREKAAVAESKRLLEERDRLNKRLDEIHDRLNKLDSGAEPTKVIDSSSVTTRSGNFIISY